MVNKTIERLKILGKAKNLRLETKILTKQKEKDLKKLFLIKKPVADIEDFSFLIKNINYINNKSEQEIQNYYILYKSILTCGFDLKLKEKIDAELFAELFGLYSQNAILHVLEFFVSEKMDFDKKHIEVFLLNLNPQVIQKMSKEEIRRYLCFLKDIKLSFNDDNNFLYDMYKRNNKDEINLLKFLINIGMKKVDYLVELFSRKIDYNFVLSKLTEILKISGSSCIIVNMLSIIAKYKLSIDIDKINFERVINCIKKKDTLFEKETYGEFVKVFYPSYTDLYEFLCEFEKYEHTTLNISLFTIKFKQFIDFLVRHKKKRFISLFVNSQEIILSLFYNHTLLDPTFYKNIKINELTEKNLEEINSKYKALCRLDYEKNKFELIPDGTELTFNEFKALANKPLPMVQLYLNLLDLKIDDRLRLFRELPIFTKRDFAFTKRKETTLENVTHTSSNNASPSYYDIDKTKDITTKIANLIKKEPFSIGYNRMTKKIKNLSKINYLKYLVYQDLFEKFNSQMNDNSDIYFILKLSDEPEIYNKASNLTEAKEMFYEKKGILKDVADIFSLSQEFLFRHKENIYKLINQGLFKIIKTVLLDGDEKTRENLKHLTKAYLSNRYSEAKFNKDVLNFEISMNIDSCIKKLWEKNYSSSINSILCTETYDFETTLRIGEIPTETCMHWEIGAYRQYLPSNFDSSKKIIVAKKNDKIIARAMVRLTKGKKSIEFGNNDWQETLVLLLEKFYSNVDEKTALIIKKEFVKILLKKAKDMNATLIANKTYDIIKEENVPFVQDSFYVMHNYSKYNHQYFDSCGGQISKKEEGLYSKQNLLIFKDSF